MHSTAHAFADDPRPSLTLPAIDHALSAWPASIGRRADAVMRLALGERLANGRPDVWRASKLTGDGFPFEVTFCTADDRLRFTLEPGAHDLDACRRLDIAGELAERASGQQVPPELLRDFKAMQEGLSLTYGAWIGCRIGNDATECKLYVEVPPGAALEARWATPLKLPDRSIVPRMIAYSTAAQTLESYVRVPSLEPRHVPAVLALAGLEAQARSLLDLIEATYGHALRGRLPGPAIGVSYDEARSRMTFHFYARALWGSDARIRRSFSHLASASGYDTQAYLDVTAPIASREDWRTFHGLLGITLVRDGSMALSIGLRPVAP